MGKKVAIVQSNYIPWKGYFDLINSVDEFILYDDMQYTRRDWRNRNKIKTPKGTEWLTIPVEVKGKYFQKINETNISESSWNQKHLKSLFHNYSKAKCFDKYIDRFKNMYLKAQMSKLSDINHFFIIKICNLLEIETKITWSSNYQLLEGKSERLLSLCQQAGASQYISGPAAHDYLNIEIFDSAGVEVIFYDYTGYPEYKQLFPPFDHYVSIIDLILNEGENAKKFMKSF
ncbi:WbqC family protein [Coleofasciculus sp. FACHB-T130]|uniref:WbqC family protein n=1 Tax=Cyanophyceae TaxID=3028117 RepID=UPI0016834A42|nr:WbqC family protein [Coleofasciculus sp. FACHB-T130]MBD1878321.1 WbqC family protein [Coleofasciculus sp. FACHB-T130]